jgi:hypothetical protein
MSQYRGPILQCPETQKMHSRDYRDKSQNGNPGILFGEVKV